MEKSHYNPSDTPFFRSLVVKIPLKSPPATFFLEPFPTSITLPADHTGPEAMQIVIWVAAKLDLAMLLQCFTRQILSVFGSQFRHSSMPICWYGWTAPCPACAIWAAHAASCPTSARAGASPESMVDFMNFSIGLIWPEKHFWFYQKLSRIAQLPNLIRNGPIVTWIAAWVWWKFGLSPIRVDFPVWDLPISSTC